MNNNFENVQYPKQIGALKRKTKTLSIDAELYLPDIESGDSPLEMHCGYSRFVVTGIEKVNNKMIYPKANIPAKEIPLIKKLTDIAINKIIDNKLVPAAPISTDLSIAYTQKILIGPFKGKTPAGILIENPNSRNDLEKTKNFLKENVAKYPANKTIIDAIEEAIHLFDNNKLKKIEGNTVNMGSTVVIYEASLRTLKSVKNNKGYCLVYGIQISCDTTKDVNYPFIITINNAFAPIREVNRLINPIMDKAEDKTQVSFKITDTEWYSLISSMERTLNNFETVNFNAQYKLSEKIYYSKAEERKKAANGGL